MHWKNTAKVFSVLLSIFQWYFQSFIFLDRGSWRDLTLYMYLTWKSLSSFAFKLTGFMNMYNVRQFGKILHFVGLNYPLIDVRIKNTGVFLIVHTHCISRFGQLMVCGKCEWLWADGVCMLGLYRGRWA